MKSKVYTICAALLFISSFSFATIRRVGYNGLALAGVDYPNFNAAHAASAPGDTIQIYGTQSGTMSKRLVVIGFGYNFDRNPNLQAIGGENPSDLNMTINPGAENSVFEGLDAGFQVHASNITFRRCRGSITLVNSTAPINNTRVESCVILTLNMNNSTTNPCVNTQVFNSIFYNITMYQAGSSGSIINCVTSSPNYAAGFLNLNNAGFLVKNSVVVYNGSNINTVWENNLFSTTQPAILPPGSNNQWNKSWADIFVRVNNSDAPSYVYDGNFDEDYYVLKPASPAIGAGLNAAGAATDCGIFGGEPAYVYKLSGVPAVPSIYKLTAPNANASSNPYNVTISVRSNN